MIGIIYGLHTMMKSFPAPPTSNGIHTRSYPPYERPEPSVKLQVDGVTQYEFQHPLASHGIDAIQYPSHKHP